jgi:hypothetical protein
MWVRVECCVDPLSPEFRYESPQGRWPLYRKSHFAHHKSDKLPTLKLLPGGRRSAPECFIRPARAMIGGTNRGYPVTANKRSTARGGEDRMPSQFVAWILMLADGHGRTFIASLSSTGIVPTANGVPASSPIPGRWLPGSLFPSIEFS